MAVKASATITLTQYRDTQSVTRYYKLQPAGSSAPLKPETKPPSSDWTDSEPACDISKELYFCDLTIFSNGEGEYSKVSKSTSYEAAKEAFNRAQAAKDSIDNLEIGGRNLLLNSGFKDNSDGWDYPAYISEYVVKDGRKCAHINHSELNTIKFARQSILGKLEPNTQYTMSGWVLTENVVKGTTNFMCRFYHDGQYDNNGTTGWYSYGHKEFPVNAGKWTHVEWTFTTDSEHILNAISSNVYVYTRDMTGDIYFCDLKLEKGNKATDWTPAPEDVDAGIANVQTDINTLSDKTRSGYIETLSGSGFVQSTKTEDGGASEVVVYGKSNQKVTQQSANLCPTYDKWTLSGGAYIDGDYIVFPSNGATAVVDVHWEKASNILYFYIDSKRDSDDAASLIIKSDNGNGWASELQTDETTYSGSFGGNNVYGDTLLGMRYVRLTLMHYQSTTGSMRIKNFMVSSTDTNYVPFVPDSPSPEYPSEIQSVENPKVTACGKNLIDRSKNTMNSYIEQDTGIMISSATTASYNAEATDFIPVEVGEPYYYSGYIDVNIGNTGAMYDDNKNFVAPIISDSDIAPLVVPNGVSYIRLTIWGIYYENGDKSVAQLEKGSTPTDYEPYKGKTATLSDIVLRSAGEAKDRVFKDSDGLWKVEKNTGEVDLGTLNWIYDSGGTRFYSNTIDNLVKGNSGDGVMSNCICSKLVTDTPAGTWNNKNNIVAINSYHYSANKVIARATSFSADAAAFKTAMSGAILYYELATPTYETLPDSIQEELNALTTYNPITNVFVSAGVTPDIDVSFWTRDYYAKNAAENAAKVATNYITDISESNGVEVKSSLDSNNKVQIKSDGMHVYQNINNTSTEVALFGNTARIGKQNDTRFEVNSDNLSAYSGSNKYFKVSPTGIGFGDNQQVLEFDPETNGLTISIPDSLYKIKITNEKIEFINTGSIDPIATISGQSLTIPKSTMIDEMQVGDKCWSWRVKDDKSLQLKWIG